MTRVSSEKYFSFSISSLTFISISSALIIKISNYNGPHWGIQNNVFMAPFVTKFFAFSYATLMLLRSLGA